MSAMQTDECIGFTNVTSHPETTFLSALPDPVGYSNGEVNGYA